MPVLMPRRKPGPGPRPTKLAEMLDSWMVRNDVTNEALALTLSLSEKNGWRSVSHWRNGTRFPDRKYEHELARLMGVAVEDFYLPGAFEDPSTRNEILDRLEQISEGVQRNLELLTELVAHLLPGVESDVEQTLGQRDETESPADETKPQRRRRQGRPPNGS